MTIFLLILATFLAFGVLIVGAAKNATPAAVTSARVLGILAAVTLVLAAAIHVSEIYA